MGLFGLLSRKIRSLQNGLERSTFFSLFSSYLLWPKALNGIFLSAKKILPFVPQLSKCVIKIYRTCCISPVTKEKIRYRNMQWIYRQKKTKISLCSSTISLIKHSSFALSRERVTFSGRQCGKGVGVSRSLRRWLLGFSLQGGVPQPGRHAKAAQTHRSFSYLGSSQRHLPLDSNWPREKSI